MFKARLAVLGALALFIVSGIVTSTASASGPFWHVGGSKLTAGNNRQVKLQLKSSAAVLKSGIGLEIECKNSVSEGAAIEGSTTTQGQGKGRVVYTQCTVLKPGVKEGQKCIIPNGQVKTNPLKSYLATSLKPVTQTKIVQVFEPGQGTLFVNIPFQNPPQCLGLTEAPVTGKIAAEIIPAEREGQEGLIAFPSPAISEVSHEGVAQAIKMETSAFADTFTGAYGARLATFPETFGVFEQ